MKNIIYTISILLLLQSCSSDTKNAKLLEGKIEREQIAVTTKIPGKIQKILVEEGQT